VRSREAEKRHDVMKSCLSVGARSKQSVVWTRERAVSETEGTTLVSMIFTSHVDGID
jgi:hypothetical protein